MRGLEHIVKRTIAAAVLAASALAAIAAPAMASAPAQSHSRIWWDTRTCRAFGAWERHTSPRAWRIAYDDSTHAAYGIRTDFAVWRSDRARHAPGSVQRRDAGFIRSDCDDYGQ